MTEAVTYLTDRLDLLREIERINGDLAQFVDRYGPTPEVTELRVRQQRVGTLVAQQIQVAAAALAYAESPGVTH